MALRTRARVEAPAVGSNVGIQADGKRGRSLASARPCKALPRFAPAVCWGTRTMPTLPAHSRAASGPRRVWTAVAQSARLARKRLTRGLRLEAAAGVLMLAISAVALAWANGPFAASYRAFWHTSLSARVGPWTVDRPRLALVNDGLMPLFFFLVGLELRREVTDGALSSWRRAALPVVAAVGGMVAPATLYLAIAAGQGASPRSGWGVPIATDIAFALGVLALLGARVPSSLRVLLLALAVIDDVGSIAAIAWFYSRQVHFAGLSVAAVGLVAIVALKRFGVRSMVAYLPAAVVAWAGTLGAGLHPTVAGLAIGVLTPVGGWPNAQGVAGGGTAEPTGADGDRSPAARGAGVRAFSHEDLIAKLRPWASFVVLPIFALANAGVVLETGNLHAGITAGIVMGLVVGKPLGVLAACSAALRLRVAELPEGLEFRHVAVLGAVAGVGFTMSLFIAHLAFADEAELATAKLAVLAASAASATIALFLGVSVLPRPDSRADAIRQADAGEANAL